MNRTLQLLKAVKSPTLYNLTGNTLKIARIFKIPLKNGGKDLTLQEIKSITRHPMIVYNSPTWDERQEAIKNGGDIIIKKPLITKDVK